MTSARSFLSPLLLGEPEEIKSDFLPLLCAAPDNSSAERCLCFLQINLRPAVPLFLSPLFLRRFSSLIFLFSSWLRFLFLSPHVCLTSCEVSTISAKSMRTASVFDWLFLRSIMAAPRFTANFAFLIPLRKSILSASVLLFCSWLVDPL